MAVQVTKDGRTILTGEDYTALKREKWLDQRKRCADCGTRIPRPEMAELHHVGGRGMGGGKRNDVPEETKLVCGFYLRGLRNCHRSPRGRHR